MRNTHFDQIQEGIAMRWSRGSVEPRPVLIPLAGHEEDSIRAIRVYSAESIPQK
jgi:hypothetical protein